MEIFIFFWKLNQARNQSLNKTMMISEILWKRD